MTKDAKNQDQPKKEEEPSPFRLPKPSGKRETIEKSLDTKTHQLLERLLRALKEEKK